MQLGNKKIIPHQQTFFHGRGRDSEQVEEQCSYDQHHDDSKSKGVKPLAYFTFRSFSSVSGGPIPGSLLRSPFITPLPSVVHPVLLVRCCHDYEIR